MGQEVVSNQVWLKNGSSSFEPTSYRWDRVSSQLATDGHDCFWARGSYVPVPTDYGPEYGLRTRFDFRRRSSILDCTKKFITQNRVNQFA